MNHEIFTNINKIIERDSKTTTYKYALLRGVIDIIQEDSPYVSIEDNRVHIPLGLLIEKWILYYYPIMSSSVPIAQINGSTRLAFAPQLLYIIRAYEHIGGFSAFYNDYRNRGIPDALHVAVFALIKKLRDTITDMPMRYIGKSIYDTEYSIFEFKKGLLNATSRIDSRNIILQSGTFSIPVDYYEAFKLLGSFINGQDSILFKWAAFSVGASGGNLSVEKVVNEVLKGPITERNVKESKKIYKDILGQHQGGVYCVWTGKKIRNYDIDHLIPFSIWKNNDLWNLLPSDSKINQQKRDKIPSPDLLERQKGIITDYWHIIHEQQGNRFQQEIQVALLGHHPSDEWNITGISQLKHRCAYLIERRGYEGWNI